MSEDLKEILKKTFPEIKNHERECLTHLKDLKPYVSSILESVL